MAARVGHMLLAFLVGLCLCAQSNAQLQVGFYRSSCPGVERIVRDEVRKALSPANMGLAAGLIRMHFHDAFVRGADGSVLIDSTANNTAEKDSPVNNPSLRGFEVIDNAKLLVEAKCNATVSCADILAFAARDSVRFTMGLPYRVPAGRRDGRVSLASETLDLLPPTANLSQLTQGFNAKGLTQDEMITLSGAHTIGRSHCSSFTDRLYSFNSTVSQDPSLEPSYAATLKMNCPNTSSAGNLTVPMDPKTPNIFDTNYYELILANRGLFTSDQALMSTKATAAKVRQNAINSDIFKRKFAAAMVKMGRIGVLTGTQGEIRLNCRKIN